MAQTATNAAVPTGPIEHVSSKPHTHSKKLEDQAALAALYVTNVTKRDNSNNRNGYDILDADHKLSSAGAAASLKYAQPHDLPSYPSSGLKKDDSAAGAAASMGWSNQKPFEHWKPDPSTSALTAAILAQDYKMAPLWQPEQSAYGAKAALLAHRDGGKVEIWQPETTTWGNSAATQAMKKGNTLSPQLDYGHTELGRKGSLMAATGAMSSSRKRAESQPVVVHKPESYPDEANAVANALSAATSAHRTESRRSKLSSEAGAVPYTTMSKEMYTSHPPVAPEVDEQNRQDTLRASAIAMAKQMYNHQQKQFEAASNAHAMGGARAAHRRPSSVSSSDEVMPMRFNSLQEAAQKLAQERLAKLHDEHAQNREYRDYYNSEPQQAQYSPTKSRMSLRGRTRRRASSEGSYDDDRNQSNKIRAQMSIFSNNLNQVDEKKRAKDREALLAAAQRNVTKSLHGMDEKVFADTGKVAPSLLSEWEVKAHAAAQAKSEGRMENYGKVDIGGGKFINQSAVDLAAQRNIQPVLDEINEKAAIEHERQATIKSEQELEKKKAAEKKTREREEKEINKKLRQQDKEEKRAREAEEKRITKEKRKSASAAIVGPTTEPTPTSEHAGEHAEEPAHETISPDGPAASTIAERREVAPEPAHIRTSMEDQASTRMQESADAANTDLSTPMSPTSPKEGSKVKNWLKTKLSRGSKPQKPVSSTGEKEKDRESSFVGGAALTGASANNSNVSLSQRSVREVAMARTNETAESARGRQGRRDEETRTVSPMSAREPDEDEEFQEARDNFDEDLAPPPTFSSDKEPSPARQGRFTEEI